MASTPTITETDRLRLELLIAQLRSLHGPYPGYVAELEKRIVQASTVLPAKIDPMVITLNSRFVARDNRTGKAETFKLTYRSECGGMEGSISVLTPLGASLLGARVGDAIEWRFRGGARELVIERMLYQPEAAGDYDR
jgi:regulator of nucleoside diphosphate kinase